MLRFRWITFDRFKVVNLSRFYRVNFIRPYWVNFTVFSTFTESGHDLQFDSGQIHNSFSLKVLKDIGGTNNIMESVGDGEPLLHYIRQRMLFLEQHPGMGK